MINNKKASLQLSIEAIVIIILAITLLGLGLTFMRQFIGKGSESLASVFDAAKLENPATALTPITIPSKVIIPAGGKVKFDVGFYCNNPIGCQDAKPMLDESGAPNCVGNGEDLNTNPASSISGLSATSGSISAGINQLGYTSVSTTVNSKEAVGYKMVIQSSSGIRGTFVCTLQVVDSSNNPYETQQIFVQIE